MRFVPLLILLFISTVVFGQRLEKDTIKMEQLTILSNGKKEVINWKRIPLQNALQLAKTDKRKVLIFFTAKWCTFCRRMDAEVFSDFRVIRQVNDNYIALKIDIDGWGGEKWRKEFGVRGVPDFFIIDSLQNKLKHQLGYMDVPQLLSFLDSQTPTQMNTATLTRATYSGQRTQTKLVASIGMGGSKLTNSTGGTHFLNEAGLGVSFERKRYFLSPQLNFMKFGGPMGPTSSLRLPVILGLNFYRGKILGMAGGYRLLTGPYASQLLKKNGMMKSRDVGFDYGLGAYLGDANRMSLEVALKATHGLTDLLPSTAGTQHMRQLKISLLLSLKKG